MPNVFEITDPDSGKTYRMEADEGVSQEEALAEFEALGPDQWSAFEYKPTQVVEAPAPAKPKKVEAPAPASTKKSSVSVSQPNPVPTQGPKGSVPEAETTTKVKEGFLLDGGENIRSPYERERSEVYSVVEQMFFGGSSREEIMDYALSLPQDLGINIEQLDRDITGREQAQILDRMYREGAPDEDILAAVEEYNFNVPKTKEMLKYREKFGKDANIAAWAVPRLYFMDPSVEEKMFEPEDPGLEQGDRSGLERLTDAYKDATQYGFPGWAGRKINDWLDSSKEDIKKLFPGRSDEWYEEMHDYAIVQAQRKLRAEGTLRQEQDPNWRPDESWLSNVLAIDRWGPWFLGSMAGSAGPEVAVAPGASLAGRAAAQTAIGGVSDVGYQGLDIAAGVEDEFSLESVGLNMLFGAGGEAIGTGIARTFDADTPRGRGTQATSVKEARAPRPNEPLDQTIMPRTTSDRRTKVFRDETDAAGNAIAARAKSLTETWTNAPDIRVEADFRKHKNLDNSALGVYRSDGTVMLNTDAILTHAQRTNVSPDDVVRSVVFHEALGHHGLASRYGAELDSIMQDFYVRGDDDYKARVDAWKERYGIDDTTLASEEVLAEMSEAGVMPVRMMDKLTNFFRDFARRMGIDLKYTDNEIRTLLGIAQRETIEGAPRAGGGSSDKYMVTYHGSRADFDEFDHSFMSTGEGVQAFGWGTYLTQDRQIAQGYKDKLSDKTVSWNGVEGAWYDVRRNASIDAQRRFSKDEELVAVDDTLTYFGSTTTPTKQGLADWMGFNELGLDKTYGDAFDFVNSKLKTETSGKLYEVSIPDNTKFIEWEENILSQPGLEDALAKGGYEVVDYEYWNLVNREAADARTRYEQLNARLQDLDDLISRPDIVETYLQPGQVLEDVLQKYNSEADELFQRLQSAIIEKDRAVGRASRYLHTNMAGEDVYQSLAANLGGAKQASEFLQGLGYGGNRYLANNLRKRDARANDGTDTFNYVIFSDKTPTITNKYMRPLPVNKQPTAVRPEDLSPDELFESMNALDILNKVSSNYTPTVMTMDELQLDAASRGISPSAMLKKASAGPGELSRSLFMYDIAAQKMNERVTALFSKLNNGTFTAKDKQDYLQTILQFEDLTAKIFDQQSEVGRALRAIQEMQFTRKRVTTLRDVLKDLDTGLEALDDPETFAKFARDIDAQLRASEQASGKLENPVIQVLNVPRALMSSMDLSSPLRQGLFFITRPQYWKAAWDMHKFFGSQKYYDEAMKEISGRPTYAAMVQSNLGFSRTDGPLSAREEDFQTDLAEKIPFLGKGVKASNRAFSGFRNKLSADMFDYFYGKMQAAGVDVTDVNNLKGMASFINAATGRGNLPEWLKSAGPQLNSIFFSPRLIASRLQLLNPVFYYKLPPVVRREAIMQAAAMGGLMATFLNAVEYFFDDVEVESDPRSSDFGKIRANNTRYDVLGGFSQYLTLGARLATGQRVSASGKISESKSAPFIGELHEGFRNLLIEAGLGDEASYTPDPSNPAFQESVRGTMSQFLSNKFSPNASYLWDMAEGENFLGEEFDPVDEALARLMPMYFQDMNELYSEEGPGTVGKVLGTIGGMYGVGVSTYIPKSLDPKQELKAPESFTDKEVADGENDFVIAKGGKITLKPEAREMWEDRINLYFTQIMDFEMSQDDWVDLTPREQANIISEAKDEARREAKKDMIISLGIK